MKNMRAVICTQYGPPEVLKLVEMEKPVPKEDEVLVNIVATTVSAADCRVRSFDVPLLFWLPARFMLGLRKPRKPVLGMEISGEVEYTGNKVKHFKKGDSIFASTLQTFGGYAEYTCLSEEGPIALKPEKLDYKEATALPIGASTALFYLRELAHIKAGQKVLVYGASSSVGTYAIQLAKYFGAQVTGVCSTKNVELVMSLGAHKVIDYTNENYSQYMETYDIILVTVDKLPFSIAYRSLNKKGIYLNIGRPLKNLKMAWKSFFGQKKIVVGKTVPKRSNLLKELGKLVENGKLRPIIDVCYPLERIVEAHRYVDKGHKRGNVVITINNKIKEESKF